MKATNMNAIAREIRNNRNALDSIISDFRAYWGKGYKNEVTKALNEVKAKQAENPANESLKAERIALESVLAKIKGLTVSAETAALIKGMHDDDKLTFSCLNVDYIVKALDGLDYVARDEEGVAYLCELRKENKDAIEKKWLPVVKWTESKVGKYFRYATTRINEQNK